MKYIKYYENIDWKEDWEEEESTDIKDIPSGKPYEFYKQYIGREVMIRPDSKYYIGKPNDPKDKIGIIYNILNRVSSLNSIWSEYIISVKWGLAPHNANGYRPKDLMLV